MGQILLNTGIVVATFLFMEFMAWFTHRYVMHGFLWVWHESHHRPRKGWFELNDLFAVVFSIPSILLMVFGGDVHPTLFWVGTGIAAYGVFYMIFHDGIVHGRLPIKVSARRKSYLRRIIDGHHLHHAVRERNGAVSFGFLYTPKQEHLATELRKRQNLRREPLVVEEDHD